MKAIFTAMNTTWAVVKIRPEKNSGLCMTSAIQVQCSTNWANKLTGSWSLYWFVILYEVYIIHLEPNGRIQTQMTIFFFKNSTNGRNIFILNSYTIQYRLVNSWIQMNINRKLCHVWSNCFHPRIGQHASTYYNR